MKRYLPLVVVCFLTISGSVQAFNRYYAPPQQNLENPVTTIQNTLDKLQKFSANKDNTNPELLRNFIEKEIIPRFAFDEMTYWIAGPYARRMNADNLQDLEAQVKKSFLNSLDKHLSTYNASSTRINIQRAQFRGPGEALVSTLLFSPNQQPDRLDFRMKAQGNAWKIVDVKANGISAAQYYRNHFISTLRQYR